jgi:reactive chlorine resistance protein C
MSHTFGGKKMAPAGEYDTVLWGIGPKRLLRVEGFALGVLRYGLTFFLVMFGALKFATFEAEGIKPFIEHSPFMSWMYALFSVRSASALLGVVEITVGVLIATRRFLPRISGLASFAAAAMFLITLSFLVTTPGVLAPTSETGGFLMKDLMLFGAALFTGTEALRAVTPSGAETKGDCDE